MLERVRAMTTYSLAQIGVNTEAEAPDARAEVEVQAGEPFPAGALADHFVEHHGLPVEEEARVGEVAVEHRQQLVEELDEPHAKHLERLVPLTIPVRVGDDGNGSRCHPSKHTTAATEAFPALPRR